MATFNQDNQNVQNQINVGRSFKLNVELGGAGYLHNYLRYNDVKSFKYDLITKKLVVEFLPGGDVDKIEFEAGLVSFDGVI